MANQQTRLLILEREERRAKEFQSRLQEDGTTECLVVLSKQQALVQLEADPLITQVSFYGSLMDRRAARHALQRDAEA